MSDSDTIRIGIVGLGGICRARHVPGFRSVPGVEIVAVANRTLKSSQSAAQELRIPHAAASWQEVVARDDVDLVVIGTWPYLHKAVTVAALEAGKHVFCQARMAMDAAEAQVMYDRARQSNRVTGLCPVPFGLKYDRAFARLVREGALGDLRLVRVQSLNGAYASADAPMNWRKDHRLSGLNMHTLGMYIEVVHRWFGWTREVSAHTNVFVPKRMDAAGQSVTVHIPDQVLATAVVGEGVPVQYAIGTAVHKGEDRIEIFGSRGTIRYEVLPDTMYFASEDAEFAPVEVHNDEYYDVKDWAVERDFIAAIRDGVEYHPDFFDGLKYMQVVEAVYTSANEDRTIAVE
jgi:predicted dehydrogenase